MCIRSVVGWSIDCLWVVCGSGGGGVKAHVVVIEAFDRGVESGGHGGVGIGIDDCDFDGAVGGSHGEIFFVMGLRFIEDGGTVSTKQRCYPAS